MKILITLTFFTFYLLGLTQNSVILDENNVTTIIDKDGTFFSDASSGYYKVGNTNVPSLLDNIQIWFAGIDDLGNIDYALSGNANGQSDLFSGPISGNYNDPNYVSYWDTNLWVISQEEIDNYLLWWECINGVPGPDCANVTVPSNETLITINSWPSHGNITNGEAYFMAPFYDYNLDAVYNPEDGDVPDIKGCKAAYMILNDENGTKTYSGSNPLGIEVHIMIYQFSALNYINDATFIDVLAINRGTRTFDGFGTSLFMNGMIGDSNDDYFGCDSTNQSLFVYNADNSDNYLIVNPPPAVGVVDLTNNSTNIHPHESTLATYWDQMFPNWQNQTGQPTNYPYSGNPNNILDWTMYVDPPNQQMSNGMMSTFYANGLAPGDSIFKSYAVLFGSNNNNLTSVNDLLSYGTGVHSFDTEQECQNGIVGLEEFNTESEFLIYPNPASNQLHLANLSNVKCTLELRNIAGKSIYSMKETTQSEINVDTSELADGSYILTITTEKSSENIKVIIHH